MIIWQLFDNYLWLFVIICNYVDDYLDDCLDDYLDPLISYLDDHL